MLWVTIGTSIAFLVRNLWVSIALASVAVAVTIHIIRFKTLKNELIYDEPKQIKNPSAQGKELENQI